MEILKRFALGLIIILAINKPVISQDTQALQAAFTSSYTHEYNGDYTEAIDALKKVYSEESYEINLRLGWLAYMNGMFTDAMAYYQNAINLKPYGIEARLGFVYPASAIGNWEQVKQKYYDILKIDPQHSLTNYRLGLIHYSAKDYNTAFKYFEKVVNMYPFDYDSIIMLAWTNYQLGKYREAKVLFNKVLLIKPDDESALEGLGLIK